MSSIRLDNMQSAFNRIIGRLHGKINEPITPTFEYNLKMHPLTCAEECIFANAQRMRKKAETVLIEVRGEDDYYGEKVALLLVEFFKANEQLARYTAEIHQSYPDPQKLYELLPWLSVLAKDGNHMFSGLIESGMIKNPSKEI